MKNFKLTIPDISHPTKQKQKPLSELTKQLSQEKAKRTREIKKLNDIEFSDPFRKKIKTFKVSDISKYHD